MCRFVIIPFCSSPPVFDSPYAVAFPAGPTQPLSSIRLTLANNFTSVSNFLLFILLRSLGRSTLLSMAFSVIGRRCHRRLSPTLTRPLASTRRYTVFANQGDGWASVTICLPILCEEKYTFKYLCIFEELDGRAVSVLSVQSRKLSNVRSQNWVTKIYYLRA
jgi:hypothetical protein